MHLSRSNSAWNCLSPTLVIVMQFVGQSRMHNLHPMHRDDVNLILPRNRSGIWTLTYG